MRRPTAAALAALLGLPVLVGATASAAIIGGTPGPGLAAVGPVSATNGYPVWYRDKNGLRLELCVAAADPLCPARGDLPDETAPVSFPDNYPDEAFYSLTGAQVDTANAGLARLDMALEGAFSAGPVVDGEQVVFARMRVKMTNVRNDTAYTFTTPVGTKTLKANRDGLIFDTEDIGIGAPGDFSGALGGRIGPFLTWDTFGTRTDPALLGDTYVGDGVTEHRIKGSPYGTNVFRVEGPNVNPSATTDACPTVAGPVTDCIETDLFTVQGKVATTAGVSADAATYSRSSEGRSTIDVYASSESGELRAIEVQDASGTVGFAATGLTGGDGRYFARVAATGLPSKVQVSNVGDVPVSRKTIGVVDRVSGTATFDNDRRILSIGATSSDTFGDPVLTAVGFGPLEGGTLVVEDLGAPPVSVVVTSAAGGSLTIPVTVSGAATDPIPVRAQADPDQTVQPGQLVTLDGSSSRGTILSYAWESPGGISLTSPEASLTTFTAPSAPGDYELTLTVTGPGGTSDRATVKVTVTEPVVAVVASAGPDQTVRRGSVVTLDGTASQGAATFAWTQVGGPTRPAVTLTGAASARPTFTFPLYHASDGNSGPLTFRLTVRDASGALTGVDDVVVTPTADTVVVTSARYKGQWRVDGTSSVVAGQRVTAHLNGINGPVVGSAVVDAAGAFSIRPATGPVATQGATVVVESELGGISTPFSVRLN
ncbi:PKD domain-containing protein [Intrasporangium flavum]|uniref:PKD domain-containing protein n=1 Tax=Intrasporangium flavum TaxID=1428657 RepID=UPI001A96D8F7|nr:PKD domain-containing protein [Intrasporangium flavum]